MPKFARTKKERAAKPIIRHLNTLTLNLFVLKFCDDEFAIISIIGKVFKENCNLFIFGN